MPQLVNVFAIFSENTLLGKIEGEEKRRLLDPPFEFYTNTQSGKDCQLRIPLNLQFSSLFSLTEASKCEIRNQGVCEDYI